ncbi:MAG: serine/threonine-protein kinase [Planctomycetota bacterium]|nr:serine/threonine-protein kinase [Planctomycetota bacterium]
MSQGPRSSADILAAHVVDLAPGDPVDLERLCSEHPAAATELRRLTAHWDQIQAVLKAMEAGQASPLAERLRRRYGDVDPGLSIDQAASVVRPPSTGGTLERLEAHEPSDSRYETRGEIARGGMGAILQVWDVDLRRTLAMKVALNKGSAEDGSPKSTDPRLLARFLEEAQITAQLDHPGIVPVHELGLDADGKVYFTMPLVRGRDLASILELVKTGEDGWTLARALNVLLKVCEAMAYAHTKEVIHRDLKPGNIMVGRFGEVYVMDWGLAKVLGREDSRDLRLTEDKPPSSAANLSLVSTDRDAMDGNPLMTMDGDVVGTPSYMSPEQARGEFEAMGPASDSIGSILYHLLAGHMPYVPSGSKRNAFAVWGLLQEEAPEPLKKIAKGAPEELVAITTKAMERDLVKRYPHMMALGEDLRAYLEGRVVSAHATGPITELRKWVGRNKPFAATIATALIAVITIVAVTGVRQARLSETLGEKETELGTKELELAVLEERVSQGQHKLADLELALRVDQEGLHEARIMLAWAQNEFSTKELEAKDLLATARAESYVANVTSTALNQDAGNYAEATRRLDAAPEELRSWEWHHLALGENAAVDSIPGASLVAAWADDGNDVIFGSEEGFLYQQVAATHQAKNNAKVGVSTVTSLSRPNSSGRLACGTADGQITNWIGTATSGETWRTSDQQITALAVSEDGELIFAGQGDRHHDQITGVWQSSEASIHKIFVYRNDGALVHQIEHPGGKVLALLPLPGGRLI